MIFDVTSLQWLAVWVAKRLSSGVICQDTPCHWVTFQPAVSIEMGAVGLYVIKYDLISKCTACCVWQRALGEYGKLHVSSSLSKVVHDDDYEHFFFATWAEKTGIQQKRQQ